MIDIQVISGLFLAGDFYGVAVIDGAHCMKTVDVLVYVGKSCS